MNLSRNSLAAAEIPGVFTNQRSTFEKVKDSTSSCVETYTYAVPRCWVFNKIFISFTQFLNCKVKPYEGVENQNQSQSMKVKNVEASKFLITTGIPQGNKLGPLLFTVYEVFKVSINYRVKKYIFQSTI